MHFKNLKFWNYITVQSIGQGAFRKFCCKTFSVDPNNLFFDFCNDVLFSKNKHKLISYILQHDSILNRDLPYRIPIGVEYIADFAFTESPLIGIDIPSMVTSIGDQAFSFSYRIQSISIPANVTFIHPNIFINCYELASIKVDKLNKNYTSQNDILYTKDMKMLIFFPPNCKNIEKNNFTIPESVFDIGEMAFFGSNLYNITFNPNIRSIGHHAFYDNFNLTHLKLPSNATSISNSLLYNCPQLETIEIPASILSISNFAFMSNKKLESIIVDPNNKSFTSIDGILFNKEMTNLIWFPCFKSSISNNILSSVRSIMPGAFEHCTKLKSISLPPGIKMIPMKMLF